MITYAGKFYDIAEYNDTFVVHLQLSCKKSHKKCFFLIYITIVRIDENKAYRHGGLYTSGRGQLIIFFYHSNTNTNRVSDNQSYLWKKVFKYTKTLFFNCVLQNTAGHKGLTLFYTCSENPHQSQGSGAIMYPPPCYLRNNIWKGDQTWWKYLSRYKLFI